MSIIMFIDTSSVDFDITLMICILRNFNFVQAPGSGWDNLPPKGDNTFEANLARVKFYRNKLAHLPNSEITDNCFKKIWTTLKRVCFQRLVRIVNVKKIKMTLKFENKRFFCNVIQPC